jgi:hypothetical protein
MHTSLTLHPEQHMLVSIAVLNAAGLVRCNVLSRRDATRCLDIFPILDLLSDFVRGRTAAHGWY